jgi:hypothetical protein
MPQNVGEIQSAAFGRSSFHGMRDSWQWEQDPYSCPTALDRFGVPNKARVLEWIRQATMEGSTFNTRASGTRNLDQAISIISGKMAELIAPDDPDILSKLWVNQVKHAAEELIATLTNPTQYWTFEANSRKDADLDRQARTMNGCMTDWYFRTYAPLKLKGALQYAVAHGSGFIHQYWEPDMIDRNTGDIEWAPTPYDRVLLVQPTEDYDVQKCYAVLIQRKIPINRCRRMFQDNYYDIHPSTVPHESRTSKFLKDVFTRNRRNSPQYVEVPMVDVTYAYIDDYSINRSGEIMRMGNESFPFYYEVPYVGSILPNGNRAQPEDCFIYPYRRLVIATDNAILYDDTSYWWHGRVPLVKFSLDEWVWDYLGHSLVLQAASAQKSATRIGRYVEDVLALKANPQLVFSQETMNPEEAKKWDTRIPGKHFITNTKMGDPVKPLLPANYATVDQFMQAWVDRLDSKINDIFGLPGLREAMKAKQIPSSDSLEKLQSAGGDIVSSLSLSIERSMTELGSQWRDLFFEFYTADRRIKILGADGLVAEDLEYKYGDMIPGGEVFWNGGYLRTSMEKARVHRLNFAYRISPTSILKTTHTTRLLTLLQARKLDRWLVDRETLAKFLEIPNYGHLDGDTVLDKVVSEQKLERAFAIQTEIQQALVQMKLQQAMQQGSPEAQMAGAMGQIGDALSDAMGGGSNGAGRPPSFGKSPSLQQKDGGTRTTTATS